MIPRIPFARAIADPNLFKSAWEELHPEQRALLKMIYGLPLVGAEVKLWHALNGGGVTDEDGYLLRVEDTGLTPPSGESHDVTLICGRRATKTTVSCFIVAYEALCGGHKRWLKQRREEPVFLQVAQDLAAAKANLRRILGYVESSPVGKNELGKISETVTADSIRLASCGLITVGPPTIKLRGRPYAVLSMDELAFWQKDKDAAAPDFEVETAVTAGMGQFPDAKVIRMSSPWTKEGLLWTAYTTGTYGRHLVGEAQRAANADKLVLKATTAMLNPTLSGRPNPRSYFAGKRAKDPESFKREFLAEFADSVSGFLPVDLLDKATAKGVTRRAPQPGIHYVATLDPAFRRDAFAVAIGHMETDGAFVLDAVERFVGTATQPLSPRVTIHTVGGLLKQYGVNMAYSDQYHVESLQDIATEAGFTIYPYPLGWKNKQQMWGEVLTLLRQNGPDGRPKLRLLDNADLHLELRQIEKTLTPSGTVRISGKRDDMAMVMALCVQQATQFGRPAQVTHLKDEPVPPSEMAAAVAAHYQKLLDAHRKPKPKASAWYLS